MRGGSRLLWFAVFIGSCPAIGGKVLTASRERRNVLLSVGKLLAEAERLLALGGVRVPPMPTYSEVDNVP